jgi:hypothetical protein
MDAGHRWQHAAAAPFDGLVNSQKAAQVIVTHIQCAVQCCSGFGGFYINLYGISHVDQIKALKVPERYHLARWDFSFHFMQIPQLPILIPEFRPFTPRGIYNMHTDCSHTYTFNKPLSFNCIDLQG